ncbi:aspartate racemase [Candidatus Marinamargulisbacteria bacterium SCGC AAA071-K20]|nr:aspartate racemase [Candidatus Marinamargulisbacteria bacterium SCGC AAA071-K20]
MNKPNRKLGVLGGMGPKATLYFLELLLKRSPAQIDQEHIHTIVDINTSIPDRTSAILSNDIKEVSTAIKRSVHRLKSADADFYVAPCNTVHYFLDALTADPDVPFFNLIEETAKVIQSSGVKKVGLLATLGTVKSRLYQTYFENIGIETIEPSNQEQDQLMHIIFEIVKKGKSPKSAVAQLEAIMESYRAQGAEKIILGCTELPIVSEFIENDMLLDPLDVLADICIKYAYS